MTSRQETVEQVRLAFELIQKLYLEVSYLVKEIEGQLLQEAERFVICRPSGYAVSTNRSSGLDSALVNLWPMRQLSVAFVPEQQTNRVKGYTETKFGEELRLIYVRVVLDSADRAEPYLLAGVFENVQRGPGGSMQKWEHVMGHLETLRDRVFNAAGDVDYTDQYIRFTGSLSRVNLLDLTSADELRSRVVEPLLQTFRSP